MIRVDGDLLTAARQGRTQWKLAGDFKENDCPLAAAGADCLIVFGLPHSQLSAVTKDGKVRWEIHSDPLGNFVQHTKVGRSLVVYHHRDERDWQWKPGRQGVEVRHFKQKHWRLVARRIRDGHTEWILNLPETYPLAITGSNELWTVSLANVNQHYSLGHPAQYTIELRSASSGRLMRAWNLPMISLMDPKRHPSHTLHPKANLGINSVFNWDVTAENIADKGHVLSMVICEVDHNIGSGNTPAATGIRYSITYDRQRQLVREVSGGNLLHQTWISDQRLQ